MALYKINPISERQRYRYMPSRIQLAEHFRQCYQRNNTAQEMWTIAQELWDMTRYNMDLVIKNYNTYGLIRDAKKQRYGNI